MASSETQPSEEDSTTGSNATRTNVDIGWEHFNESVDESGKKSFTCLYCQRTFKGGGIGGIDMMKRHLARKEGDISPCTMVPIDVNLQMVEYLKIIDGKKKESKQVHDRYGQDPYDMVVEEDEKVQEVQHLNGSRSVPTGAKITNKGKRKATEYPIYTSFAPRTTPGDQPSIKNALAKKEAGKRANMCLARWMFDCGIPASALNSIYFQPMLDAIAAVGPGYKFPNYHDMRVNLLRDLKEEISLLVDSFRGHWKELGCTIMADDWIDTKGRTLINFLVYYPRGITFVKSVDASDIVKDANALFSLFDEVVEWVGPSNVVHMVTDNVANYVSAGRLLCEKYTTVSWSPCAARCINLMLEDIAKMGHVSDIVKRASKITIFVYNHMFLLSWLRKRSGWKEIVCPGPTKFATTFIIIKRILEHKHDLQALVTSKFFVESRYAKDKKSKYVVSIVLDNKFWNDCLVITEIVEPLIRLLRIVDSDERPAMGFVYEGMHRAIEGVKKIFGKKKYLFLPYTKIMKGRWDKQLRQNIHAAAYWLNPVFQYDQQTFCNKPEVMLGIFQVIENKVISGKTKMVEEIRLFRDRLKSFGGELALLTCKTIQPDEWWKLFGTSAPNLQKLAIRILSQTAASLGCERNWSVFERLHTTKRNRLEHQRLNDVVFVHYNLRLKNRLHDKKKSYDPVDYENIDKTEEWIIDEEEESPLLNYEDLEKALYEEGSYPVNEGSSYCAQEDDDGNDVEGEGGIDLGSFAQGCDDEDMDD